MKQADKITRRAHIVRILAWVVLWLSALDGVWNLLHLRLVGLADSIALCAVCFVITKISGFLVRLWTGSQMLRGPK